MMDQVNDGEVGSRPLFENRTCRGALVSVAQAELVLESRRTSAPLPWGRLIWARPTAVLVRRGQAIERLPIVDLTRVAQVAMLAASIGFWAVGLIITRRREKRERERE